MMIVAGIVLLGFVSSGKISINLLPDITYPKLTIRTEYPHAAPTEVENLVTRPIEQAVGIITEVIKVSSVSKPGISEVIVEFSWRADMDVKTMDIREKLQITESIFPDEIKRPVLLRYDPSADPIITLAVAADMDLADLRYLVEREIERELERIEGVAAVKVQGGYEEEIVVEVDEGKLAQYGLSIQSLIDRLRRENINLAGGTLDDAGQELSI
jgi:HAE1 family hydrophobic/amphiphilic exporter-1